MTALQVLGSFLPTQVAQVSASGKWEVTGSIRGRDIPKSLKLILVAPRLALRLTRYN